MFEQVDVWSTVLNAVEKTARIENNDLKKNTHTHSRNGNRRTVEWTLNIYGKKSLECICMHIGIRITKNHCRAERSIELENVRDNFIYYPFSIWFHCFGYQLGAFVVANEIIRIRYSIVCVCCVFFLSPRYVCYFPFKSHSKPVFFLSMLVLFCVQLLAVISLFVEFMPWFTLYSHTLS